MKPIWKILIAVAVVIALAAALLMIPHYRAKAAITAFRERLKRQGEKLTIAELTPVLTPAAVNAGLELQSAASMASNFTNSPPMMRWLAPGRALVGWQETISPTEKSSNCWPEFSVVVKRRPEIASQISEALQGPDLGFSVQYQQGFSALLPYLVSLRRLSVWLTGSMTLDLHEGDTNNAWRDLWLETELVRKYRGEPIMICQIVRGMMMNMAIGATWEALQYRGWSEEQLMQLQTDWEAIDLVSRVEPTIAMERAFFAMAFDESRQSYKAFDSMGLDKGTSLDQVLVDPRAELTHYLGRYPRYWVWLWRVSYQSELFEMELQEAAIDAVRAGNSNNAFIPALENFKQTANRMRSELPKMAQEIVANDGLIQEYSNFVLGLADGEMARRMTVTAIALERYQRRHGEYPARLEELVPDFLRQSPIDCMDGKPLRYRRRDDGTFLMYSVGEDGKNDGGDGSPLPTDTSNFKRWYKMRDAVWPTPATADEVKNYEADMLKKVKPDAPRKPGQLVPPMSVPAPAGTNAKTN